MMRCLEGSVRACLAAYDEAYTAGAGMKTRSRSTQLYPYWLTLNLFGSGYVASAGFERWRATFS